jgi:hypothetical protein
MNEALEFTESGSSPPQRHRLVPPPVPEWVAILCSRYPLALICTRCAALLATRPQSYSEDRSSVEIYCEANRLSYICFECRLDIAEAEKVKALRAELGRQNIAKAHAANRERALSRGRVHDPLAEAPSGADLHRGFSAPSQPLAHRRKQAGRPQVSALLQRLHRRKSQRLRRAGQRQRLHPVLGA